MQQQSLAQHTVTAVNLTFRRPLAAMFLCCSLVSTSTPSLPSAIVVTSLLLLMHSACSTAVGAAATQIMMRTKDW
jgi:hypothetical protein